MNRVYVGGSDGGEFAKNVDELDIEELKNELELIQRSCGVLSDENEIYKSFLQRAVPERSDSVVAVGRERERREEKRGRGVVKQKQLSLEHRVDIVLREIDEMRAIIDKGKMQAERHLEDLKAAMEETDTRISEIKKEAYEFRRDVVVGAENPRTKKIMAEKAGRYIEDKLKSKVAAYEKLKLKNANLRNQLSKMEAQLVQREEMGEVLLLIDFDQLKIENQQYIEKIEDRNRELLGLKLTTGNTMQVLNALKEKLNALSSENDWLEKEINTRRTLLEQLNSDIEANAETKVRAMRQNTQLSEELEATKAPSIVEYVEKKALLHELQNERKQWARKVEIAEGRLRTMLQTRERIGSVDI